MAQCLAHCLAENFDPARLKDHLDQHYPAVTYRDVIHIHRDQWHAFLFDYGVLVAWGMPFDQHRHLLDQLRPLMVGELAEPFYDDFNYEVSAEGFRIHLDNIRLPSGEALEMLAASHAIAQSVKLGQFEQQVARTIDETAYIPESIAHEGRTKLSGRELARMRGRLYLTRSAINLRHDLLDTPEFFWEYPAWQEIYDQTVAYLEVGQRLEVLNARLAVIQELLQMLADEHNHRHSSRLEWIIIWLIALEFVLFLLHDLTRVI